jgi:hypothetical protein
MKIRNTVSLLIAAPLTLGSAGCALETVEGTADEDTAVDETEAATVRGICPATVPAALNPDPNQTIKGRINGVGVQIYVCLSTASVPSPTWTFVAPQANLLTDGGYLVGTHFIGPTWQDNDGSSVAASRVAGATVDATAIPWLLLKATSHSDERGYFKDITSIQRLNTVGGIAPASGCDADHLGAIVQVPYSAEYVFYKTKARGKVSQCKAS